MKEIKVRLTFLEDCLGTASNNKEVHSEYIASKAPDHPSKEEEIAAIGVEETVEKAMTVFPRDEDGNFIFWDYQIRGFFKEACSCLRRCKGEDFSAASNKMKAFKKIIDGNIFVEPRKIPIDMNGGEIGNLQRPLRAQTMQGERISLANSETIPEGSVIEFSIVTLSDDYIPAIKEWLDYGRFKGLGQWRNAGYGRFKYEIIE
jgi:hypothetical protein